MLHCDRSLVRALESQLRIAQRSVLAREQRPRQLVQRACAARHEFDGLLEIVDGRGFVAQLLVRLRASEPRFGLFRSCFDRLGECCERAHRVAGLQKLLPLLHRGVVCLRVGEGECGHEHEREREFAHNPQIGYEKASEPESLRIHNAQVGATPRGP